MGLDIFGDAKTSLTVKPHAPMSGWRRTLDVFKYMTNSDRHTLQKGIQNKMVWVCQIPNNQALMVKAAKLYKLQGIKRSPEEGSLPVDLCGLSSNEVYPVILIAHHYEKQCVPEPGKYSQYEILGIGGRRWQC